MNKIKVLVIDPSIEYRKKLKLEVSKFSNIEFWGTCDIKKGRDCIVYSHPDVLVINKDINGINILKFLQRVFAYKPIPTIVTGDFDNFKDLALDLIDIGVLDVVSHKQNEFLDNDLIKKMIKKIFASSLINVNKKISINNKIITKKLVSDYNMVNTSKIIAIGASTGGPIALKSVICSLPKEMPPILIAQHMPKFFITSFANHLDQMSKLRVVEAQDNEEIKAGTVYIAPGDRHLEIKKMGGSYFTKLTEDAPVHFQRPAVENLMNSMAKAVGKNGIGVILTGMGKDGARGLLNMKKSGAYTIGQDEESSIVYGMPKEAYELGAVKKQLPLDKIPIYLFKLTRN